MFRRGLRSSVRSALTPSLNKFNSVVRDTRWALNFNGVNTFGELLFPIIATHRNFILEFIITDTAPSNTSFNRLLADRVDDFRIYLGSDHSSLTIKSRRQDSSDSFRSINFKPLPFEPVKLQLEFRHTEVQGRYNIIRKFENLVTRETNEESVNSVDIRAVSIDFLGRGKAGTTWQGQIYNLKIDNEFWPLDEKDHLVQLPFPSMLGPEMVNPQLPAVPAPMKWTDLGGGRWSINHPSVTPDDALIFILTRDMPDAGLIEFEIEHITGSMTCTNNSAAGSIFSAPGKYRFAYRSINQIGNVAWRFRVATTRAMSCIIKNVSFKPLYTVGLHNLCPMGDFNDSALWRFPAEALISSNKLVFSETTAVRSVPVEGSQLQIEAGKTYEITFDVLNRTSGRMRILIYGSGAFKATGYVQANGRYSYLLQVNEAGGSFTKTLSVQADTGSNLSVANITLKEVLGICNPITLQNVVPEQWQQVPV